MKPLNNRNFGNDSGSLTIKFYDGFSVVTGWIKKQVGSRRFLVSDGTIDKICSLCVTETDLEALLSGTGDEANNREQLATIEIGNQHVSNISTNYVRTIQGNNILWRNDSTTQTIDGGFTIFGIWSSDGIIRSNGLLQSEEIIPI